MLKLSYLREFITLAETLSFSRTSEIRFISQPALSRHIAAIEEEFGSALFTRNTRSVVLTESGKIVYKSFVDMLKKYDDAKSEVDSLSSGITGTLRISSPYYWTVKYTEPLVQMIHKQVPGCKVDILSCLPGDGLKSMINGDSDIAISSDMLSNHDSIRRVPFAMEQFCAFVDRSLELSEEDSLTLSDLKGHPILLLGDPDYPEVAERFVDLFVTHGINKKDIDFFPIEQVDSVGLTFHNTKKIGVMMSCLDTRERPYIKCIPLEEDALKSPLFIYYRMDNVNPLILKMVYEINKENIN